MKRSTGVLDPSTSILFICDMQDKFQNLIYKFKDVLEQSKSMALVCKALDIPIIYTEQNPNRLGKTIKELREISAESKHFEKTIYSMCIPEVLNHLNEHHKHVKSIIIVGIAAHVCVIQSAIDFAEKNYDVHIILDAISSVSKFERLYALERMKQSDGIYITTLQSIAFQLSKDAKHKSFKTIGFLLKDEKPVDHLLNDSPFYSKLQTIKGYPVISLTILVYILLMVDPMTLSDTFNCPICDECVIDVDKIEALQCIILSFSVILLNLLALLFDSSSLVKTARCELLPPNTIDLALYNDPLSECEYANVCTSNDHCTLFTHCKTWFENVGCMF